MASSEVRFDIGAFVPVMKENHAASCGKKA
jgi:hypothetical protein